MARNVEIKARLNEERFERLRSNVEGLTSLDRILDQTDTFFCTTKDRLKLREFGDGSDSELIAYSRSDQDEPKLSDYIRTPITHADRLKESLRRTIGIRGVVVKRRWLYLVGQTRIHLDDVAGLGKFVELEVVLTAEQTQACGVEIADGLVDQLEIPRGAFLSVAYIDLLETNDG